MLIHKNIYIYWRNNVLHPLFKNVCCMCITTHPLGIHTQLDAKKIEERESMFCKHGPFLPVHSPICIYYLLNMDDAFCMNFLCLYRRTSLVKKYITFVLDIHVLLLSNRDVNRMLTNVLFLLDTLWIKSCHNLPSVPTWK